MTDARVSRGWRRWLAVFALAAVACPSSGSLPWLVLKRESHHHVAGSANRAHDERAGTDDASDIPGSPTHPLDHDCAQCQVLKHLARGMLPALPVASVPPPAGDPVLAFTDETAQIASLAADQPPIRGPPPLLA